MTALAPRPRTRWSTTAALVDAAIDGDERAWAAICDRHLPEVRAVAHARLRDDHAAEDVVQETFLRAWTRLPRVRDPERIGPWLKAIAANVAVDHVRRQRATAPLEVAHDTADPAPSHDDLLVASEEAEVLHGHLRDLRPRDRRALWHRDANGMPVSELAEDLGMTPGSVRVLLTRARKQVRSAYGAVVAPVAAVLGRWRQRLTGLGEAVPAAVAAPVVAVVVVSGVATPDTQPPSTGATPSAPTDVATATATGTTPERPDPAPTRQATPTGSAAPSPAAAPGEPARPAPSEPSDTGPAVTVADGSAGFTDTAPGDDDRDAEAATSEGPVESIELYLEEAEVPGLDEDACLVCD